MPRKPAVIASDDSAMDAGTLTPSTFGALPGALPVGAALDYEGGEQSIENVLSELGGISDAEAKIMVYRAGTGSGRTNGAFLYECHPSEFSLTDLAERFGGGTYRIRGYKPSGGRRVLFINQSVEIEEPKNATRKEQQTAPTQDISSLLAPVITAIGQGMERLGALIVQNQQPQQTRQQMLEELLTMQKLFAPAQQSGPSFSDMFKALQQGIEIGKGQTPPEDMEGALMLETVKSLGPVLSSAFSQAGAQSHPRQQQQLQSPSQHPTNAHELPAPELPSIPTASQPAPSNGENDMNLVQQAQLKAALHFLCKQAARGADPEVYADLVYDQIPTEELQSLFGQSNWFEILAGYHAPIRQYHAWFLQLGDAVSRILTEESQTGSDDALLPNGASKIAP